MGARPWTRQSLQHAALFIVAAALLVNQNAAAEEASSCPALLQAHKEKHPKEAAPLKSTEDGQQQMLYFLHVPRTAGRTFHGCFLKLGTQPHKRCPKGYDHLRMDMSAPGCAMLSTHDDFSIVSLLPSDVAVLTHLRDPVDRVLSAYEFAVEVGSRHASRPANVRKAANKIATDEVWPWSSLVPFIAEDVKRRRAAPATSASSPPIQPHHWVHVTHPDGSQYYYNKYKDISKWNLTAEEQQHLLPPLNPYENDLVISLKEFVEHPIAQELLHNGQVFQVLGITNYSHWDDASTMRRCFWQDAHTHEELSKLAQARISRFSHVGTTDKLAESVTSAAVSLNLAVDGAAWGQRPQDLQTNFFPSPHLYRCLV
ncbi:hypothetical protein DUNSADRAFT_17895 [Dunaliella salina]|uniref:Sulfotransferase n=1 Tax=Dunaliella salina TaxID=3046 RepID=A0ABQ7H8Y4_DUNSA|nr:hypothetical protein DUNSADRAFT_17895 [Dunaliella salina]|eukprot:KAF5843318.1 hypothetical protein DUNSADRAFT_17895 [Dunaliella salina]